MKHEPFYGCVIVRDEQEALINRILNKYKDQPAEEGLQKTIWDELSCYKAQGILTIPFKVILKKDPLGTFAPIIEVILDTKV